ncbi:hypothetical protein JHK87_052976 [Glycine soja]|nr:hypothetical protein JHK87_052976 [Glycine soja]
MTELVKFHKDVESVLENLTDDSQVLSWFEGFPSKKLEDIRMVVALYLRLDSILFELQNWNIVTPMAQFVDKVERYFNKIKAELDGMERTKDEESKKFKGHNIEFDFHILIKIKEAMVDVSSNCMELALKDGITRLLNQLEQELPLILEIMGLTCGLQTPDRGTKYSCRHISLDPSSLAYWNWSWDEIVSYDLLVMFNYVFSQMEQKINYVGHSLGTLIALASFSEGKLVSQLKSAALLSPIAYLSHMNTKLGVVVAKSFVGEITTLFGLVEFNPKELAVDAFLKSLCAHPGIGCYDLLTALTG